MTSFVAEKKEEIAALCRKFKVRRLDLFGSAAKKGFNEKSSDLDFLVSFIDAEPGEYARCYFSLADALEKLFQKNVDLITERSVRNPFFRQEIDGTKELVYGT